ncbi:hypothetical protein TRVA0_061S00144 [Trichomonascus vanleenenianus]|uniref:amidohydrolase family protein n=1 Tax=Trichomonascus vanleenenianus TaxID=2268995 RepID=UPI003EC9F323
MERIDVHAHCVPPAYREYCLNNAYAGKGNPDGMPGMPEWDALTHIALMDKLNIKKSILSISSPGTNLSPGNDAEARKLTRLMNTEFSKICASHPDRFGFFASLPLPDVEGTLAEIDYAIDELGAIGFQILTNSHGIYPGDERFRPVFDKLNSRKTIVFFHPTTCHLRCSHDASSIQAVRPQPGIPSPMLEFMFDTTRALTSVLLSGTVTRCPDLTFLVCHGGATFPPLLQRVVEFSSVLLPAEQRVSAEEVRTLLQKNVYFDLAGMPFPDLVHGLLRVVDSSRLLYGSDYPWTPAKAVEHLAETIDEGLKSSFESDLRSKVLMENAQEFLRKK